MEREESKLLKVEELLNDRLRRSEPERQSQKLLDLYFERSEFNNQPKSISCNNDFKLKQRLLKNLFSVPQLLTLFHLVDLIFILFSIGLVIVWDYYNVTYEPDIGTIITLILFPLTYAMGNSFSRRSEMLSIIARLRTSVINLVLGSAAANHNQLNNYLTCDPTNKESHQLTRSIHREIGRFLDSCKGYPFAKHEEERLAYLQHAYCQISRLHWLIYFLSKDESEPSVERMTSSLLELAQSFESFRTFIDYGASTSLKYFLQALIYLNTIFLTPLFTGYIKTSTNASVLAYLLTISIMVSLIALFRIQGRLENPIGDDFDDINLSSLLRKDFFFDALGGRNPEIIKLRLGHSDYTTRRKKHHDFTTIQLQSSANIPPIVHTVETHNNHKIPNPPGEIFGTYLV